MGPHVDAASRSGNVLPDMLTKVNFALINIGQDTKTGAEIVAEALKKNPNLHIVLKNSHPDAALKYWLNYDANTAVSKWWADQQVPYNTLKNSGADLTRIFWTGANELEYPTPSQKIDRLKKLNAFEASRMMFLETLGVKACIGEFSWGMPGLKRFGDTNEWFHFYDALLEAHLGKHLLGLHEYWFGKNGPDLYAQYSVRRHRAVWEDVIATNGWTDIRIGITEAAWGRSPGEKQGYRGGLAYPEYLAQLKTLHNWTKETPYVLGVAVFGQSFQNQEWGTFDIGYDDFRPSFIDAATQ